MRIAVVNKLLIPSGMVRWSAGWSKGLSDVGNQVEMIFLREARSAHQVKGLLSGLHYSSYLSGTIARLSEAVGSPFVRLGASESFEVDSSPDPITWALAPIIGRWDKKFDLVIASEEFTGLAALAANLLNGTPYVLFFQEAIAENEPPWLSLLLRPWRLVVSRRAALCVGVTTRVAASYQRTLGIEVKVIPHGCNPAPRISTSKQDFVLADTRWTPVRDPAFLLDVAELVDCVRFVVAGSFASHDAQARFQLEICQRNLGNRVQLATGLTEEALTELYRTALVYVRWAAHSSETPPESGPSFGIFQALSQGCPIIADTNLSMDSIVISRFKDWVLPRNPSVFAERIEALAANPSLVAELSLMAWETAKELSWTNRARQLTRMLQRIMDGRCTE